jgi:ubiquinone/menaquinone biosynthesis C-methylase UbiE
MEAGAYKQATVEQWTADPCGEVAATGETGTDDYFASLDRARREYAPWMNESLDYAGAAGLDVLDVGSGQGIDLVRYARAGARVTGVDLTPRHVELARAHLAAAELPGNVVLGDAEELPFEGASFDLVSSNGVLHHTPDIAAALREIRRVLRPGGRARVILYNRSSLHYWIAQFLHAGLLARGLFKEGSMEGVLSHVEYSGSGARPLVRVYSPRQARRLLRDAGFAAVTTTVRHFHAADTRPTELLERFVPPLRDPEALDRIGRVAGWYVIAEGRAASPARETSH